ncbi:MAG TPA: hypothetical protein VIJ92_05695 [Ginsengibacter sp.]
MANLPRSTSNNKGYNKYLKLEGEVTIAIDEAKFKDDSKWDGLKATLLILNSQRKLLWNTTANFGRLKKLLELPKQI